MSKKRGGDIEKARTGDGLSHLQRAFVREFLVDRNGTQAAIRAGYSPTSAGESACELLRLSKIKELVEEKERRLADMADVDAALIISELREIALGDPRDLVSLHRGACRFCYGIDHDRQWTVGEYRDAWYEAMAKDPNAPAPPLRGGTLYDFTREPNPDCPECRGLGDERVIVKDTRKLSKGAAKLIASIKQSKDGSIELKHRDQDGALLALGKVRGIFLERSEVSGPGGGPLQLQPVLPNFGALSDDELRERLRLQNSKHPLILEGHTTTQRDSNGN